MQQLKSAETEARHSTPSIQPGPAESGWQTVLTQIQSHLLNTISFKQKSVQAHLTVTLIVTLSNYSLKRSTLSALLYAVNITKMLSKYSTLCCKWWDITIYFHSCRRLYYIPILAKLVILVGPCEMSNHEVL